MFSLEPMKEKTFASVELKKALEIGYTITKIYSALQYKKYNGLMKDYVAHFIKMKIENSGLMTDEECNEVNEYHKNLGFTFEIKSENCKNNPGLRMISKICLNSLWGKFGQRDDLENYEFMNSYNQLLQKITDPKLETTRWDIISENIVELRYKDDREKSISSEFISEITAIFTTANARIRLYDMLSWLHPSQIIYADTDSCYFLYDKTNELHKKPDNNDPTLPKSVKFGDGLGCWKFEHMINEMVVAGAKSYAYKSQDGKVAMAMKGITMDVANSKIVDFDRVKNMVFESEIIETEARYQFVWDRDTKQIKTIEMSKKIQSTIQTKRNVYGMNTFPIGYEEK